MLGVYVNVACLLHLNTCLDVVMHYFHPTDLLMCHKPPVPPDQGLLKGGTSSPDNLPTNAISVILV